MTASQVIHDIYKEKCQRQHEDGMAVSLQYWIAKFKPGTAN